MTPAELALDGLAAQEVQSLGECVARGQVPTSYLDIVAKIRVLVNQLPEGRKNFWTEQCMELGVDLYPPPPKRKGS